MRASLFGMSCLACSSARRSRLLLGHTSSRPDPVSWSCSFLGLPAACSGPTPEMKAGISLGSMSEGGWLQLLELENPVEDDKGYVYDKAAIVDYLRKERRQGRDATCPVAGDPSCLLLLHGCLLWAGAVAVASTLWTLPNAEVQHHVGTARCKPHGSLFTHAQPVTTGLRLTLADHPDCRHPAPAHREPAEARQEGAARTATPEAGHARAQHTACRHSRRGGPLAQVASCEACK